MEIKTKPKNQTEKGSGSVLDTVKYLRMDLNHTIH